MGVTSSKERAQNVTVDRRWVPQREGTEVISIGEKKNVNFHRKVTYAWLSSISISVSLHSPVGIAYEKKESGAWVRLSFGNALAEVLSPHFVT